MALTRDIPDGAAGCPALLKDGTYLVGGEWVPGAGGQVIKVLNPATGDLPGDVPRAGIETSTRR